MDATAIITDEILVLVFQRIVSYHICSQEEWANTLFLLAVCRKWRTLALPVVYRNVYVELSFSLEHIQIVQYTGNIDAGMGSDITSKTNISLFEALGLRPLAKRFNVQFIEIACVYYAINELSKILMSGGMAVPWQKVSTLIIPSVWYSETDFSLGHFEPSVAIRDVIGTAYAEVFSKATPNIVALICHEQTSLILHGSIERKIIESYTSQLRSITSYTSYRYSISLELYDNTLTLTRLSIRLQGSDSFLNHLPRVYARTLQYLCILDMSDQIAWRMFSGREKTKKAADGYTSENITFTCLTQLRLHYNHSDAADSQETVLSMRPRRAYKGYRVCFPQLERLQIVLFSLNCTFFCRQRATFESSDTRD